PCGPGTATESLRELRAAAHDALVADVQPLVETRDAGVEDAEHLTQGRWLGDCTRRRRGGEQQQRHKPAGHVQVAAAIRCARSVPSLRTARSPSTAMLSAG